MKREKPKNNGCGECGGRGKVLKTVQRGSSIDVSSVRCPKCKGKGTPRKDIDLMPLVAFLAGERE